ncbi:MAG: hypothetical protein ABJA71_13615 [Ginsengibacter sp.]
MKHSAEIYKELKEVSPFLAEVEKTNVFSVPEDYFSTLDKQFLQRIKNNSVVPSPQMENNHFDSIILPASEPHFSDVPEGYFDNLPANILKKIKSLEGDIGEELKQLSPMLYAVQNENVFSVPKGYFETLPGIILSAVKPQAKIAAIKKRSMVWDYAAAAMLSAVMAVSALWISKDSSRQNGAIAKVNTVPSYIKEASKYKNQQQINEGISNLADDDIIKYLETTGSNADDELLSTVIQENELPDEKDYLLNGHTLETFLNNMDLKNTTN